MATGQKAAFTPAQVATLRERLGEARDYMGLALLCVAVDSMLRVSDLVRLRVSDLRRDDGAWRPEVSVPMRKLDGKPVVCNLLSHTLSALAAYTTAYRLKDAERLFPISSKSVERMVKTWAVGLGLDPKDYACHSLRRTKSAALAEQCTAAELDQIRVLLGHRWLSSTQSYLGTSQAKASALARSRVV